MPYASWLRGSRRTREHNEYVYLEFVHTDGMHWVTRRDELLYLPTASIGCGHGIFAWHYGRGLASRTNVGEEEYHVPVNGRAIQ